MMITKTSNFYGLGLKTSISKAKVKRHQIIIPKILKDFLKDYLIELYGKSSVNKDFNWHLIFVTPTFIMLEPINVKDSDGHRIFFVLGYNNDTVYILHRDISTLIIIKRHFLSEDIIYCLDHLISRANKLFNNKEEIT